MSGAAGPEKGAASPLAFWLSAGILVLFSQLWVSIFENPMGGPADPILAARLRTIYFPAYGVILALAAPRLLKMGRLLARAPALLSLLVLAALSVFWTIDVERTERRLIALLLTTVFGLYVAERFTWAQITRLFALVFLAVTVLSVAYAALLPLYGRMQVDFPGAWRGVYDHKNALGYAMSVALAVFVGAYVFNPRERRLWGGALVAAFAVLLLSTSKTALVAGALAFFALALPLTARRGPALAVGAVFAVGAAVWAVAMILSADPALFFNLLGKDQTFTGRTEIWAAVGREIAQRPFFGFGYGAVWENREIWGPLAVMEKAVGFTLPEAHNSWLQVALDLGWVGAVLWTLVFAGAWARTMAFLFVRPSALFVFPFLVVFSLHAFTEAGALLQNDIVWILFTVISVRLAAENRLAPSTQGRGIEAPALHEGAEPG